MSPLDELPEPLTGRFPRVSGDEPLASLNLIDLEPFSPRERG